MKRILIFANHFITIYAFRKELVEKLLIDYEVYLAFPESDNSSYFEKIGCKVINTPLERRNTNPIADLKLLVQYIKILLKIKPDVVLTYTIKPNIYGGIASRLTGVNIIHTVTGLGSVYIQEMWQKKVISFMNKIAFRKADTVFFLNDDNKAFYENLNIVKPNQKTMLVPGSGVNLDKFKYVKQPNNEKLTFTFIARILKDKGIEEFLFSAEKLKQRYSNIEFKVVGFVDEAKYKDLLNDHEFKGNIVYLGRRDNIPSIMAESDCIVLPSYGEGRGTVLQEAAAVGRPLITTDTYGCKENVEEGKNGYLCEVANGKSLKNALEKFICLSDQDKELMGLKSREKAEKEFDRNIVIEAYIKKIKQMINKD